VPAPPYDDDFTRNDPARDSIPAIRSPARFDHARYDHRRDSTPGDSIPGPV
jgi:hypothetical protein